MVSDSANATAPASHGPTREPFAAGDVLLRFPPSTVRRLAILSPIVKPGWRARTPGTYTTAVFPGSAVRFEGEYFEVHAIAPPSRTGEPHRYELRPWEERFPIREAFDYTREECERVAAAVRAALRKQAAAHTLAWLMPLVGFLPARLQIAIEDEYGLPAARSTFWSAWVLLGVGALATMAGAQAAISRMAAGPALGPASLLALRMLPLSFYLTVEALVRYRLSFSAAIPCGSLPVAAPVLAVLWLWDFLRRRHEPAPASDTAGRDLRGALPVDARDKVRDLPDGRLEILSLLPKPQWGPRTAVHFRDLWWALADREALAADTPSPDAPRWRFVLEPWPEHAFIQDACQYSPDEVRAIAFDTARERHRAAVESMGPLLGLLDEATQARLAEVYGHAPRQQTGWSIVAVAGGAAFGLWVAVGRLRGHAGGLGEGAIALGSLWLLLESGLRGFAWLQGRVVASALAGVVRPLARRFLRLGPES